MRVVREVTAMERAGAQINANDGEAVRRRDGEGLCLQTKTLPEWRSPGVPVREMSGPQRPPGGRGAHLPCSPLPSPSPGSALLLLGGVGEDGTDF